MASEKVERSIGFSRENFDRLNMASKKLGVSIPSLINLMLGSQLSDFIQKIDGTIVPKIVVTNSNQCHNLTVGKPITQSNPVYYMANTTECNWCISDGKFPKGLRLESNYYGKIVGLPEEAGKSKVTLVAFNKFGSDYIDIVFNVTDSC